MDLTSLLFLFVFLPLFVLAYLVSSLTSRLPLVVAASVIFISLGQPAALAWLGSILAASYALGRAIAAAQSKGSSGKLWMLVGVAANIGLLAAFKFLTAYSAGGLSVIELPAAWISRTTSLAIPLGLSYVTFQAVSYLVDVWRRSVPAERNFLGLAAYLLFFPKLVSGPLVRYKPFAEQLARLAPTWDDMAHGLRRLFVGFVKRTVIASQLARVADGAFNLPTPNLEPRLAWLALAAFSLQIFFDFSGYTDMALGLGLMIGLRLPENFNFPYTAQSVSDFWRRWHMSLAGWFREYVFYPLERRRLRWAGQQFNLILLFLLIGAWHGFKQTFLVWGLLHGLALAIESAGFGRWLKRLWRPLRHAYALLIILTGWVFFRSSSMAFAFGFFRRLAGDTSHLSPLPFSQSRPLPLIEPSFVLVALVALIGCFPWASLWIRFRAENEQRTPALYFAFQVLEDSLLMALFVLGLAALLSGAYAPNLYAKF